MKSQEIVIKKEELDFTNFFRNKKILSNTKKDVAVFQVITTFEPSLTAEIHENCVDVFIIKEGSEELFIGGEMINKKLVSPGEWVGTSLVGARKYQVGSDDIVVIPKGVAHQHGQGQIKFFVIKIS